MPTELGDSPSVLATQLLRILRICCLVQLLLGILCFFVDIWEGILMLVGAMVLFCVTKNKNWCTCVCYVVLVLMDTLTCIDTVGSYFVDHDRIEGATGVLVFFSLIKLPFYLVSVFYTFLSYRELKGKTHSALYIEHANNPNPIEFSQAYGQNAGPPPQAAPSFLPYTGRGYTTGT